MKSRENLVRLKKFQVSERRRQLAQLDLMIGEFERMARRTRGAGYSRRKESRNYRRQPLRIPDICQGGPDAVVTI